MAWAGRQRRRGAATPTERRVHVALALSAAGAMAIFSALTVGAAYGADAVADGSAAENVVILAILAFLYIGLLVFRLARTVLVRRLVPDAAAWSWPVWWTVNRGALPRAAFLPRLLRMLAGRGRRQERMWQDWVWCAVRMTDPGGRPDVPEPAAPVGPALAGVAAGLLLMVAVRGPVGLVGLVVACAAATWPMAVRTMRALGET